MRNKCNCQLPNTDLGGRCFKCGGFVEMPISKPMTPQERIKADAEAYAKSHGRKKHGYYALNYIEGATTEHDRAQVLTDRLGIALENIYNIHSHMWSEFDRKEITSILEQWKSGKGKEVNV